MMVLLTFNLAKILLVLIGMGIIIFGEIYGPFPLMNNKKNNK